MNTNHSKIQLPAPLSNLFSDKDRKSAGVWAKTVSGVKISVSITQGKVTDLISCVITEPQTNGLIERIAPVPNGTEAGEAIYRKIQLYTDNDI